MCNGVSNMYANRPGRLMALVLLLSSPLVDGQTTESDWLEKVEGHKGEVIGAEIRDIEADATNGREIVTVAIPKSAVSDPDMIEEIVVVAKKPTPSEPVLDVDYKWVRQYDRDYYGLIIHLGENTQWPIRLFMSAGAETHPYNR